ncbi:MAG TPA: glycosyltransferase family 4 protein, partial [bacterium]
EREAAADEARLAARADAVAAVSVRELDLFRAHARPGLPAAVVCHPCAPSPTPAPFAARTDLLFVGAVLNADSPNVDTIRHLAREVLPRVRREEPVRLVVAGTVLLEEVLALASPEVVVTGRVDDMRHWYDRCRVFVAPTRYAAGIPLKLLEAFAAGIPAVISPLLAEQLGADESVALIAGDPEEFARKVVRLYRDEGLWNRLRQAALEHVGRTCSPAAFREAVSGLLAQLVRGR